MDQIKRSKIKLVLIGIGCMADILVAHAGLIFSQPGSYRVHGKVSCQKDKAFLIVAAGTQSEIPVRFEPIQFACQFYSGKTVKTSLNLNSVQPPLSSTLVEGTMKRAMKESLLMPPVLLKENVPVKSPVSAPVKK